MKKTLSRRYLDFISSPAWQKQRLKAFHRWGRKCSACHFDRNIEVHHLCYRNLVDVTAADLMPLCQRCHTMVHEEPLASLLRFLTVERKRSLIVKHLGVKTPAKEIQIKRIEAKKFRASQPRRPRHSPEMIAALEMANRRRIEERNIAALPAKKSALIRRVLTKALMSREEANSKSIPSLKRALRRKRRDENKNLTQRIDSVRDQLHDQIRANPNATHFVFLA